MKPIVSIMIGFYFSLKFVIIKKKESRVFYMTNKEKLMKLLKSYGVTEYYADFDENEKYPNGNIVPVYRGEGRGELDGAIYSIYTLDGLVDEGQSLSVVSSNSSSRYFNKFISGLTRREVK